MPKQIPTIGDPNWGIPLNAHLAQLQNPSNGGINSIEQFSQRPINLTVDDAGKTYIYIQTGNLHQWTGTTWKVLNESVINVKDYGAVGDGVADDTAALQNILYNVVPGRMYLPAGTYVITDTLIVPYREWAIFGEGTDNDLNGSQSIIKSTRPDKDFIKVQASGFNIRNITFSPYSGADAKIVSVTSNSITMENLINVKMAEIVAEVLSIGMSVYKYRIYNSGGKLYRSKTTSGVVSQFPTHSFGISNLNGIDWEYNGSGSTYNRGAYANGTQWMFNSINGNTLLDVYPAGFNENYTPLTIPQASMLIGRGGQFIPQFSYDGKPSNGTACINLQGVNDPFITGCWFLYVANAAIVSNGSQGGCWTNNEMDNGKVGFSGDLNYNIIKNNRFSGADKAIYIENGRRLLAASISENHFQSCNNCFTLIDNTFSPTDAEPEESKIMHTLIANNKVHDCGTFIDLKGGRSIHITGNHTSRLRGTIVDISNSKKIAINNNFFTGVGENLTSTICQYVNLINKSLHIVIKMNQFDSLNSGGEQLDYIIKKDNTVDATKLYIESNEIFDYAVTKYKNF